MRPTLCVFEKKNNRNNAGLDTGIAMTATMRMLMVERTVRGQVDLSNGQGDLSVVVDDGLGLGLGLDLCRDHDHDPLVVKKRATATTSSTFAGNEMKIKRCGVSRATCN